MLNLLLIPNIPPIKIKLWDYSRQPIYDVNMFPALLLHGDVNDDVTTNQADLRCLVVKWSSRGPPSTIIPNSAPANSIPSIRANHQQVNFMQALEKPSAPTFTG